MTINRRHVLTGAIAAPAVIAAARLGFAAPAQMLKISHQFPGGTYTIDGNDHHVMRVYETIQGKETLTMEVDYKKTK